MKAHIYTLLLFVCVLLSSCERTTIGDTDLDFKLTEIADQKGYVGKPIELKTEAVKLDVQNNYPFQIKINSESGNIQVNGITFVKDVYTDVTPQDGKIFITYNPTQIGEDILNISVKNQLVERHTKANINISADLYSVEVANQPPRPLIDTKFNFDLLVKEAESTGADSILTYAKVIDGIGNVYSGEELISSKEDNAQPKAQLYIGKNQITYISTREGENTIRFFFKNKYGNETYKDVKTTIFLPAWKTDISTGKDNVNIPLKEKYSINLSLEEEDIFKDNSYTGTFRILTNNDLTLSLNAKEVKAGETFTIKQGGNIGELFINEEVQSGAIEFIVKDKYKQEKKDTIRFTTKLPVKPIDASLDETSKKVKVNNKVTFRISVSEVNYNDVFGITCQLITGQGAFDNPEMTVSKGTHEIVYLATQAGVHTFKVTVTDKNGQKKELNATVQAEIQPILTLNKTDGGAVSGGGTYDFNTQAVAAAVPVTGYSFAGWYKDGVKVSDAATYTFTITANTTLEARFTPNKYNIVTNATDGGTATGGSSFDYNAKATVIATANTGYNFLGWYENDKQVSDSPTYSFTVTSSRNLTAKFAADKHSITTNATAGGTVTGAGNYDYNSNITVKATPNTGYSFAGWYESGTKVSDSQTYSFVVTKNRTLEARFTPNKYNIVINTTTGGAATGGGTFDYNSKATVMATAETGYSFTGWYKGETKVSDSPAYSFTVTESVNLTAKFAADKHSITTNATAGGTVTGAGNYDYNTNVTVKATPNTGYSFAGWYESGTKVSDSQSYNFVVKGNRVLEARFTANRFNVIVNAQTGGTASGSGAYDYNSNCTVRAIAGGNYTFAGWYEGSTKVSSSAEYTFKVLKETTLEARFTVNKYTITLSGSNGTQAGGGSYDYNTNATVKATPNTGYAFTGWYEGVSQVSTSNPYIFKVERDRILEARYQLNKFTVTAQADNGGSATGGGQFDYGTNTQLRATPNTGYSFAGWYEGSTKISGDNPYTLTVVKDRSLTAKFNINTYTLSLTAGTGGSVSGAGTYEHNKPVTVIATPTSDYTFAGWYEGSTMLSNNLSYTFNIIKNTSLSAKFEPKKFTVQVTQAGVSNATITGQGTYNSGASVTVKATPPTEADFAGWYENGNKVSSNLSYTFTIKNNVYLEARFNVVYYTVRIVRSTGGGCYSAGYQEQVTSLTVKRGESVRHSAPNYPPGNTLASWCGWYFYEGTTWKRVTTSNVLNIVPDRDITYFMHWYSEY
jgi:uncharacterized repeat protein (TIGR02543 family)